MSGKLENRRQVLLGSILKRDTALMEYALGVSGLINAAQVLTIDGGKPLAPFLFTAVSWLNWGGGFWVALLTLYGIFSLFALSVGLATGNTFFWRSIVSLYGAALWLVVAVATVCSSANWLIGFRYGFTASLAFLVAVILIVKHDYKTSPRESEDANAGI